MADHSNIVLVYVPCGSAEEVATLGRHLLEERLIACANIYQSRSLYVWKGELADEEEHVLVCKKTAPKVQAAERRVEQLHHYDVPCIIRIEPARSNPAYAAWVTGEVSGSAFSRGEISAGVLSAGKGSQGSLTTPNVQPHDGTRN